jgi:hypothetical protein
VGKRQAARLRKPNQLLEFHSCFFFTSESLPTANTQDLKGVALKAAVTPDFKFFLNSKFWSGAEQTKSLQYLIPLRQWIRFHAIIVVTTDDEAGILSLLFSPLFLSLINTLLSFS